VKKDPRHRAREAALQIRISGRRRGDVDRAAETFFAFQWPNADPPSDELRVFASGLAHDAVERLGEVDTLIAETAANWRPSGWRCSILADSANGRVRAASRSGHATGGGDHMKRSSSRARLVRKNP